MFWFQFSEFRGISFVFFPSPVRLEMYWYCKYGLSTKLVQSRWLNIIGQVSFFTCLLVDRVGVEVHNLAKKERGQYPAILTEKAWSIKDLFFWLSEKFFSRDTAGGPEWARYHHLARSGSQSRRAIWFILSAHRANNVIRRNDVSITLGTGSEYVFQNLSTKFHCGARFGINR